MIVEVHIIQNLAPANVNRDDTGAPKECIFGGFPRARISSQSQKRAMRTAFKAQHLIEPQFVGMRTQRAAKAIADRLSQRHEPEAAGRVANTLIEQILKFNERGVMQYLVLFSQRELDAAATLCEKYWQEIAALAQTSGGTEGSEKPGSKKKEGPSLPLGIKNEFTKLLDGRGAADLALFGRMIADIPEGKVDASCQVAHAIGTHALAREMDYYTAIDDLAPEDTTGAGMIGTVEFNSSCFYRYANVDTKQLLTNLGDDRDLAARSLHAFIEGMVTTIPTGKQHSMAAQNPPSLVMMVVRDVGLWSLTNAFVKPIQAKPTQDLVTESIRALDRYWGRITGMYGMRGIRQVRVAMIDEIADLINFAPVTVAGIDQMFADVLAETFASVATQ